jgi:hypothetical protein
MRAFFLRPERRVQSCVFFVACNNKIFCIPDGLEQYAEEAAGLDRLCVPERAALSGSYKNNDSMDGW